jgi:hypothetical protein
LFILRGLTLATPADHRPHPDSGMKERQNDWLAPISPARSAAASLFGRLNRLIGKRPDGLPEIQASPSRFSGGCC